MSWYLNIEMDTDDDAEIFYKGRSYCMYGENLVINETFPSKHAAIVHMQQKLRVCIDGKADQMTKYWIDNVVRCFKNGYEPDSVNGKQTYTASLEERKEVKYEPYTLETFPKRTVWIRGVEWEPGVRELIGSVGRRGIATLNAGIALKYCDLSPDYQISLDGGETWQKAGERE